MENLVIDITRVYLSHQTGTNIVFTFESTIHAMQNCENESPKKIRTGNWHYKIGNSEEQALKPCRRLRSSGYPRNVTPVASAWIAVLMLLLCSCATEPGLISTPHPAAPLESSRPFLVDRLPRLDAAITNAIAAGSLPGGVLWVERSGVAYHKAFGWRSVEPGREPMSEDTIFDAASLTKVIATTSAIMKLYEQGRVSLDSPVARYIPEFGTLGKEGITLQQLMTHTSGLRPDVSLKEPWTGYVKAIGLACAERPVSTPGTQLKYSDINFFVLGEVVRRVSGEPLNAYCDREIFQPLGMFDTRFIPCAPIPYPENDADQPRLSNRSRIAPTELLKTGTVLRGMVHDPTARRMGGVAGHAGLFTTSYDLARFCRMLLGGGMLDGRRILRPETVARMTSPATPPGIPVRGLGWDIDSPYAGQRGERFPVGGYGHTGWTGTSLWIDPFSQTFVIFLSNRNHPTEKGSIGELRRQLGTLAAEAVNPDASGLR